MQLQRFLIGVVVCLAPLFTYCLLLIALNSRKRATLVAGTWDFAGVLLASSGFILAGGPAILAGLNPTWRWLVLKGRLADWNGFSGWSDARTLLLWATYFLMVLFGSVLLIWRRRHSTVIYNVDTAHFWSALEWVFGRLGIAWQRFDDRYELQKALHRTSAWQRDQSDSPVEIVDGPVDAPVSASPHVPLLVQSMPSACNVTLRWSSEDPEVRAQVEAEIGKLLPNIRAERNEALSWLISIAITLFSLITVAMVLLLIAALRWRLTITT